MFMFYVNSLFILSHFLVGWKFVPPCTSDVTKDEENWKYDGNVIIAKGGSCHNGYQFSGNGQHFIVTKGTDTICDDYRNRVRGVYFATPNRRWHLVTGIFDKQQDKMKSYLDGNLMAETLDISAYQTTNNYPVGIGIDIFSADGSTRAYPAKAKIDELRFYNRALSDSEIQQLYVGETTLTVNNTGNGSGRVTGQGINCGSDCVEEYDTNSTVTLTATPDSNSIFSGWSDACSGTGTCTITMNKAQHVMASFTDCTYSITPTFQTHSPNGENGFVTVKASPGCTWTAQSNTDWVNITSGSIGKSNGTVNYLVTTNSTLQNRRGTLTIAGQFFTINQSPGECTYSITPTNNSHSANAETGGRFSLKTLLGCSWTAHSNQPWVTVTAGQGQSDGTVTYSIDANTSTQNRQATITVAGQPFTINQGIPGNTPPVSVFTAIPAQGTPPLTVTVDGRNSSDKEGIITDYAWRTSDSQTAAAPKTSFTFTKPGNYQITLTVTDEKNLSASKTMSVIVNQPTTRLTNISTRAKILGGINNIVAGFVIRGTETARVMIRGFGLENSVNPYLKLQEYPNGNVLAGNNDWQKDPHWAEIPTSMKLPKSTDAGLIRTLPVGAYTVTLSSIGNPGLGLIGINVIESAATSGAKLENISTRASIQGEGAYDIIAGFIITGTGNQKIVIRGWGLDAGVDPYLKLEKYPSGDFVAHNNNWLINNPRATEMPGHMNLPKVTDAAIVVDLPAGAYTATLMSVGVKGLGLIGVDAIE
jgi:hypothetical protein